MAVVSGLPYPTPTRLDLANAIVADQVRHYHWERPWTCLLSTDREVTARVAELVRAGLAELGEPAEGLPWSMVALTEAGTAWLHRARERAV